MKDKDIYQKTHIHFEQDADVVDRRGIDRRQIRGEGFTYVSTVGWICRREQARRNDDECDFNCGIRQRF